MSLSKIEYLLAGPEDEERFFGLYTPFVRLLSDSGGEAPPTDTAIEFFRKHFREYTSGSMPGVALMAIDDGQVVGVLLWGANPDPGMVQGGDHAAYGWGVYVIASHQRQGISTQLRRLAVLHLDDICVESVVGVVLIDQLAAVESTRANGFVPTHFIGSMDVPSQARKITNNEPDGVQKFYWVGQCPLCGRDEQ